MIYIVYVLPCFIDVPTLVGELSDKSPLLYVLCLTFLNENSL